MAQKNITRRMPASPAKHQTEASPEDKKREIYQEIKKTGKLPSPDMTALEIFRLANDEDVDYAKLRKVVEKDPAISSRVMQLANSAFYRSRLRISSLNSAFVRLGMKMLGNVALGVSLVSQNKKGPCREFDYEEFWSGSVARSVAAWRLAADRGKEINTDVAFTAGLLGQIGRLAFATVFPEKYGQVIHAARGRGGGGLIKQEINMFGMDHNELAAKMMTDWNMPEFICQAVQYQDSLANQETLPADSPARELARMLQWSKAISVLFCQKQHPPRKALDAMIKATQLFGIPPEVFGDNFDMMAAEWLKIGSIFEVITCEVLPWEKIYTQAG
jgi:two-component system cell cycle response regulator